MALSCLVVLVNRGQAFDVLHVLMDVHRLKHLGWDNFLHFLDGHGDLFLGLVSSFCLCFRSLLLFFVGSPDDRQLLFLQGLVILADDLDWGLNLRWLLFPLFFFGDGLAHKVVALF